MSIPRLDRFVPNGVWPVILIHFLLNIANGTSRHIEKAFFRTLVSCEHPSTDLLAGGHRRHHHWTGSAHCGETGAILRNGVFLEGQMWFLSVMMHVMLLPLVAAVADRWGRRRVLLGGILGIVAFLLLLAASQRFDVVPLPDSPLTRLGINLNVPWFAVAAYIFRGITFNFGVVWGSMIFDLTSDNTSRACAFALLEVSNQCGEMTASLFARHIGHFVLSDYSRIYIGFACLCALGFVYAFNNIPETLHTHVLPGTEDDAESNALIDRPPGSHVASIGGIKLPMRNKTITRDFDSVGANLCADVGQVLTNPKLLPLFVGEFLGSLASGVDVVVAPMTIAAYGWQNGDLQIYQAPLPMIVLASILFIVPAVTSKHCGQPLPEWHLCVLCGINIVILAVAALSVFDPIFLLIPRYMMSMMAFQAPLMNARIASLVPAESQAKLFALRSASSSLAYAFALQLFTSGLVFDMTAGGSASTVAFMVSSLLGAIGLLFVLRAVAPVTCCNWLGIEPDHLQVGTCASL